MFKIISIILFVLSFNVSAEWYHSSNIDSMTDEKTTDVYGEAISGRTQYDKAPTLVARCSQNKKLEVYINFYNVMDDNNITLRFDRDTAMSCSVSRSTDYKALFMPKECSNSYTHPRYRGFTLREFIVKMQKSNILLVRATEWPGTTTTYKFNLTGFTKASHELQRACNIGTESFSFVEWNPPLESGEVSAYKSCKGTWSEIKECVRKKLNLQK